MMEDMTTGMRLWRWEAVEAPCCDIALQIVVWPGFDIMNSLRIGPISDEGTDLGNVGVSALLFRIVVREFTTILDGEMITSRLWIAGGNKHIQPASAHILSG